MSIQEHTNNAMTLIVGSIVNYTGISLSISPSQGAIDEALKIVVSGLMALLTQWILMKRQQRKNRKSGGNNTAAVLALLILLPSCTIRKIRTREEKTTTAVVAYKEVERKDSSRISSHLTIKDTVLKFPMRFASGFFRLNDLTPLFTPEGTPVPRTLKAEGNGIRTSLTVNPDSSVSLHAESDSLQMIIPGLIQRIEQLESFKATAIADSIKNTEERMTLSEVVVKSKSWLSAKWTWVIGALIVIILGAHGDTLFNLLKRKS